MPEVERTNYEASGRMGYTAIDRFRGDKCQEFLTRFRNKKEAELVAGHLNSAYQRGREEMMEELVYLAKHPGGIFYINQMLMAANDPMEPVTVTRLVSDMADHERTLACCAEHFNASPGNPVSP